MNQELSDFAACLREMILPGPSAFGLGAPSIGTSQFSELALELFALQFQCNPPFRSICEARQRTPRNVEHWTQIPFVPTAAFKELELSCIPAPERTAVFYSSGTTEQKPSRHFHCAESLAVYEASLWAWFATTFLGGTGDPPDGMEKAPRIGHGCLSATTTVPLPASGSPARTDESSARPRFLFLTPDPTSAPHSSLVHMFETVRQRLSAASLPANGSPFIGKLGPDGSWGLDFEAVLSKLRSATGSTHRPPILLLGTAFTFVHLLDFMADNQLQFNLPPGSRVMETGGYKNRSRELPKAELHALISEKLGIASENILCEYGMSELSSQAYQAYDGKLPGSPNLPTALEPSDRSAGLRPGSMQANTCQLAGSETGAPVRGKNPSRYFQFPPWVRAQIISPQTGREVAEGETGLIRIFDLANVFSVAAVQTEDLGVRRGDGFELIGRAPQAEPRGCSLNALETWKK